MMYWAHYALGLLVVALLMAGLSLVGQGLRKLRHRSGARLTEVLESTMLSPHATLHLVRVGSRYMVVGAARESTTLIMEVRSEEIPK